MSEHDDRTAELDALRGAIPPATPELVAAYQEHKRRAAKDDARCVCEGGEYVKPSHVTVGPGPDYVTGVDHDRP